RTQTELLHLACYIRSRTTRASCSNTAPLRHATCCVWQALPRSMTKRPTLGPATSWAQRAWVQMPKRQSSTPCTRLTMFPICSSWTAVPSSQLVRSARPRRSGRWRYAVATGYGSAVENGSREPKWLGFERYGLVQEMPQSFHRLEDVPGTCMRYA